MRKSKIKIEGMHCASCSSNVQKSLSKVKGVSNIRINLLLGKGYLDCEDFVKEEDLRGAIKKAGFSISNLEEE